MSLNFMILNRNIYKRQTLNVYINVSFVFIFLTYYFYREQDIKHKNIMHICPNFSYYSKENSEINFLE